MSTIALVRRHHLLCVAQALILVWCMAPLVACPASPSPAGIGGEVKITSPLIGDTFTGVAGKEMIVALNALSPTGQVDWEIAKGALPTGLSIGSCGIGGTLSPDAHLDSPYVFTLQARTSIETLNNTVWKSDAQKITVTVLPPLGVEVTPPLTVKADEQAAPFTFTIVGGVAPYDVSSSVLPAGFQIAPKSESTSEGDHYTISGAATSADFLIGPLSFDLVVRDSHTEMSEVTSSFVVDIEPQELELLPFAPSPLSVGEAVSLPVRATSGYPPYTFSVAELPSGLALVEKAGEWAIEGVPLDVGPTLSMLTVADFQVEPTVKSLQFVLNVIPPRIDELAIGALALPTARVDEGFGPITLEAEGGSGTYQWLEPKGLPEGIAMEFDSNHHVYTVHGVPEDAGEYFVEFLVRDTAHGDLASSIVLLKVLTSVDTESPSEGNSELNIDASTTPELVTGACSVSSRRRSLLLSVTLFTTLLLIIVGRRSRSRVWCGGAVLRHLCQARRAAGRNSAQLVRTKGVGRWKNCRRGTGTSRQSSVDTRG